MLYSCSLQSILYPFKGTTAITGRILAVSKSGSKKAGRPRKATTPLRQYWRKQNQKRKTKKKQKGKKN